MAAMISERVQTLGRGASGAEVFLAAEEETEDSAVLDLTMDNSDESDLNVGEANHDLVGDNMQSLEISDHDLITLINE
jgi:hypothetical protein